MHIVIHSSQCERLTCVDVVACVAKAGHGFWNHKTFTDHFVELTDYTVRISELGCTLMVGPFFTDPAEPGPEPQTWRPWKTSSTDWRQLGLEDVDGKIKPINDQLWSAFQGRLGISQETSLLGGHYIDNTNMSNGPDGDWTFVWTFFNGGKLLHKLPEGFSGADGPVGPGLRDWVTDPFPVTQSLVGTKPPDLSHIQISLMPTPKARL